MIKEIIIKALFDAAVKISKEPDIIKKSDVYTYSENENLNKDSFFIIRNGVDDIATTFCIKREIIINYEKIKDFHEITRVFVIMWCGFAYFKNISIFNIFLNTEMYTDIETIQYMCKKSLFNLDTENQFIIDIRSVIMKKEMTPYNLKRLRNIINTLMDNLKDVKN